jgi:KUP system potassium uptake protein
MIATSILFANYLVLHRVKSLWIYLYLVIYFSIEFGFLFANLDKFPHGGYVTLVIGGILLLVM